MLLIDDCSYRKDLRHPVGHGYSRRPAGARVLSVVVHATHGAPGSRFENEAAFLRDSASVSAHYLIGRQGQTALIVAEALCAWHAGQSLVGYHNETSVGIELHAAATEPITAAQRDALAELVRGLMARYSLPRWRVRTHRDIARPKGRKSDPGLWPEGQFAAWRAAL